MPSRTAGDRSFGCGQGFRGAVPLKATPHSDGQEWVPAWQHCLSVRCKQMSRACSAGYTQCCACCSPAMCHAEPHRWAGGLSSEDIRARPCHGEFNLGQPATPAVNRKDACMHASQAALKCCDQYPACPLSRWHESDLPKRSDGCICSHAAALCCVHAG